MLSHLEALTLMAIAMTAIVATTLLPSKAESMEGVALYSPQRVIRQLTYDQREVTILCSTRNFLALVAGA